MEPIRVIVQGALGRMGTEVIKALTAEAATECVGAVDLKAEVDVLTKPGAQETVPLSADLEAIITGTRPDVLVDFSVADAVMPTVRAAARHGVNLVIGTTGLSAADTAEMECLTAEHGVGMVVAPNFSLGAVVMMHLAKIAGRYFDYAEIIELHHHNKLDAPSGTSRSTARGWPRPGAGISNCPVPQRLPEPGRADCRHQPAQCPVAGFAGASGSDSGRAGRNVNHPA